MKKPILHVVSFSKRLDAFTFGNYYGLTKDEIISKVAKLLEKDNVCQIEITEND